MSDIYIDVTAVAQNIVDQLKSLVPVRTGRLKNSIKFEVKEGLNCYTITLVMEDYFKWLKPKMKQSRLPSPRELAMASPPLPKMNDLGKVRHSDLSPRSQGIMNRIDLDSALNLLDRKHLEEEIRKILIYD